MDDELFAELDRALLEWKVLIVRDQPIDVAAQGALALRWGPLTDDQLIPNPGTAAQTDAITFERNDSVVGLENMWHTDGTFRDPPAGLHHPAGYRDSFCGRRHPVRRHGRRLGQPRP